MKKLLALILTIGMIFTLASCGGDKAENGGQQAGGAKKIDYANMTEDDLIKKFIKDEQNITLDEFINLASTYSYATINDKLELDENITDKAIKKLKDNKAALPAAKLIRPHRGGTVLIRQNNRTRRRRSIFFQSAQKS